MVLSPPTVRPRYVVGPARLAHLLAGHESSRVGLSYRLYGIDHTMAVGVENELLL